MHGFHAAARTSLGKLGLECLKAPQIFAHNRACRFDLDPRKPAAVFHDKVDLQ